MRAIRSVVLAALSVLALIGFMASAQAAGVVTTSGDIVTLTFTGTVSSSTDPDGIFGCTTGSTGTCNTDNPDGPYAGDTYPRCLRSTRGSDTPTTNQARWYTRTEGRRCPRT